MTDTRETRCRDKHHPTCSLFVGLGRFELPAFGPPDRPVEPTHYRSDETYVMTRLQPPYIQHSWTPTWALY